jgi:A118 family predicted phage portal protein
VALPVGGKMPWPPKEWQKVYQRYAEHAAWYSGDPEQLAGVYGGAVQIDQYMGTPARSSFDDRGAPIFRRFMFWARRGTQLPYQRVRLHIPIASDIAMVSADLLFAEPVEMRIAEARQPKPPRKAVNAQARLDELVDDAAIHALLLEAAEKASALGGVYLRVNWDVSFTDHPFLTAVESDSAVPEFHWGELSAVTFWRVVATDGNNGNTIWRPLERHEPGFILHGLYMGDRDNLGEVRPLTEQPATAPLANQDIEGNSIATGTKDLTAVYVPNMKPNRTFRGMDVGRSDYQSAEGLMDALDETYTSWMRDLRLARARIIVPAEYMSSFGKGKGGGFDIDQEVFTALEGLPLQEGTITENQFQIRTQEHQATAKDLVDRIVATAGYSYSTFGVASDMKPFPATATEVAGRERRSLITRAKKSHYWSRPLSHILEVLLQIDANYFGGAAGGYEPTVVFPDAAPAEPQVTATTIMALSTAKALSTHTKVVMLHPEWTPDEVNAEVTAILSDPQPAGAPSYAPPGVPADAVLPPDDNPI